MIAVLTLGCGHSYRLTYRLDEQQTRVGRSIYCGSCRRNRTLVEYSESAS